MLTANTRIVDVKPENRVKSIQKTEAGDLLVEFHSGACGVISKDDPLIQAFTVYSVLAEL